MTDHGAGVEGYGDGREHHVANTGRFRILMLRRFAKPLEGPGGSGYPPILMKKEWDVYPVAAKGF